MQSWSALRSAPPRCSHNYTVGVSTDGRNNSKQQMTPVRLLIHPGGRGTFLYQANENVKRDSTRWLKSRKGCPACHCTDDMVVPMPMFAGQTTVLVPINRVPVPRPIFKRFFQLCTRNSQFIHTFKAPLFYEWQYLLHFLYTVLFFLHEQSREHGIIVARGS